MKKTVTVFGSSKPLPGDEEYEIAYKLGRMLAQSNFNVCNGGFYGTMEAVSKGSLEAGGKATGIIINQWGLKPNSYLTEVIECNTLFERVSKLIETGDALVVLQGGTGTLLELAAAWELMNKDFSNRKPVFCHSELWKLIVGKMNEQMEKEGRDTNIVLTFDSIEEIIQNLKNVL